MSNEGLFKHKKSDGRPFFSSTLLAGQKSLVSRERKTEKESDEDVSRGIEASPSPS